MLFRYFEQLVDPYPSGEPGTPPRGLFPFILHFKVDPIVKTENVPI